MATENVYSDLGIPPGEFLPEEVEARGLPVAALLAELHLDSRQLERLLSGDERITAEMALDLENMLQLSADFWLGLQTEYDLTLARNRRLAQSA